MERTQRRARPALLSALALATPLALASGPASAAPDPVVYDALGDSYAAGFGVPEGQAYPYVLAGRMSVSLDDDAAVPGAVIQNIPGQLQVAGGDADVITVSIGGNNVGWGAAVGACVGGSDLQCQGALGLSLDAIDGLGGALDTTYALIRATVPDAHVVVTGYPRLFSPEYGAYLGASPAEQQAMNDAADRLNAVMADAAADAGFQFVDVTQRFVDHGVNAPDAWILGVESPARFHPTVEGQHAYGVALRSQVNPTDLR